MNYIHLYSRYVFTTFHSQQIPEQGDKNQYAFMFLPLCYHFLKLTISKKLIKRTI